MKLNKKVFGSVTAASLVVMSTFTTFASSTSEGAKDVAESVALGKNGTSGIVAELQRMGSGTISRGGLSMAGVEQIPYRVAIPAGEAGAPEAEDAAAEAAEPAKSSVAGITAKIAKYQEIGTAALAGSEESVNSPAEDAAAGSPAENAAAEASESGQASEIVAECETAEANAGSAVDSEGGTGSESDEGSNASAASLEGVEEPASGVNVAAGIKDAEIAVLAQATINAGALNPAADTGNTDAGSAKATDPAANAENAEGANSAANTGSAESNNPAASTGNAADAGNTGSAEDEAAGQDADHQDPADEWANRVMADVEEEMNIRTAPDENSEIAGKFYRGDVAEVLSIEGDWTQITSGNVTGYVRNDYLVYDTDAYQLANEVCSLYATVNADGLRLRSEPTEEADILTTAAAGDKLQVDKDAESAEGWVAVSTTDSTAFVSEDYVDVALNLGTALNSEEVAAKEAEEAEAKAEEESKKPAVSASSDDVTLLGALIQCESGSGSYDGMVAVGAVVMNRVRSGGYPGSISGVIYQAGQFTPALNGSVASVMASGVRSACLQAAQEAINGKDNTNGALSFRSAGSGASGTVIGGNVFF